MNEQLAAIRARREAVTPGVWEVGSMYTTGDAVVGVTDNRIVCVLGTEEQCHADATFIAAAPADIDTLLAHVTAVTAERDALAQQLQQAQDAANVAWQEEHAARLVLEERLKAAEQRETALQEMIADTSTQAATTPSA